MDKGRVVYPLISAFTAVALSVCSNLRDNEIQPMGGADEYINATITAKECTKDNRYVFSIRMSGFVNRKLSGAQQEEYSAYAEEVVNVLSEHIKSHTISELNDGDFYLLDGVDGEFFVGTVFDDDSREAQAGECQEEFSI